jgi:hypothetical protein
MGAELAGPPFAGGCQCGAIRYALATLPIRASICHCRMRQKTGGAPFMAFAAVNSASFLLTRGEPALFASSDIVERGFWAACGSPLTCHLKDSDTISVTIASLDDPARFAPDKQLGIETRPPWFAALAALPQVRTGRIGSPGLESFTSGAISTPIAKLET